MKNRFIFTQEDGLVHYGIKGQQWGVQHGPPYPIQPGNPVKIKKGTKIQRLSTHDEKKAKGHAYVTYNSSDNERYKGFFGIKLKTDNFLNSNAKIYVHDIEAKEDLRSPSKKERIRTFIDIYRDNPSKMAEHLGAYEKQNGNVFARLLPKFILQKSYKDMKNSNLTKHGYKMFVRAIGGDEWIRNTYFKELKKKGYNFVQDDQDSGHYGKEPGIVLNRKKSLKYNGKNELKNEEIVKNFKKYGGRVRGKDRHKEWE